MKNTNTAKKDGFAQIRTKCTFQSYNFLDYKLLVSKNYKIQFQSQILFSSNFWFLV